MCSAGFARDQTQLDNTKPGKSYNYGDLVGNAAKYQINPGLEMGKVYNEVSD